MREPTWTEVDGVPVVWTETSGRMGAILTFRVGIAYETAVTHGISHLTEHLALHGMHARSYDYNGATALTQTAFYALGRPEEAVEFLTTVCASLADLPTSRTAVERQVLRAEGERRTPAYRDLLLSLRYGARAHGLGGYSELGLHWLDEEHVRGWTTEHFTRGNALLALSGPPPAGLRLPLLDGPENAPLVATPSETVVPGWTTANTAGIAASFVVPRTMASMYGTSYLAKELNRVLRFDRGLTYSCDGVYELLDAERGHFVVSADAEEANIPALREAFVEVLERIAAEGVDEETVAAQRTRFRRDASEDDRQLGHLGWIGSAWATGHPLRSIADIEEAEQAVTADDVSAWMKEVAGTALYAVPPEEQLPERYPRIPWLSPSAVEGDSYKAREGDSRLVVGDDGVSIVYPGEGPVTIRWDTAAAVTRWNDGALSLLGTDGFRVNVVAWEWENGDTVLTRVTAAAPPGLVVPMDRPSPWPAPTSPRSPGSAGSAGSPGRFALVRRWWLPACGYLFALVLLVAVIQGPQAATATSDEITEDDLVGFLVLGLIALGLAVLGTWRRVRGPLRRPH